MGGLVSKMSPVPLPDTKDKRMKGRNTVAHKEPGTTGKEHRHLLVKHHHRQDFSGNTETREEQQMLKLPRDRAGIPLIQGSSPVRSGPDIPKSFQMSDESSPMKYTEGYKEFFVRWAEALK